MTPTLVSWSGGKDAAWTLHALRGSDAFEPVGLVTTLTQGHDRVAMHRIRHELLLEQVRATGLPVIEAWQPQRPDNEAYERAFVSALSEARERLGEVGHIAFGDIFLEDVRSWREALCARHGWGALFPLFGRETGALAREMVEGGLRGVLTCVDTEQLDAKFSGHAFDEGLLEALPKGVDPCGERGEFHTLVTEGPMLARALAVRKGEQVLRDGRFAFTDFAPA